MPQVFINKTTCKKHYKQYKQNHKQKQYQKYKQQKANKNIGERRGCNEWGTNKTTSMNNVYKTIPKV